MFSPKILIARFASGAGKKAGEFYTPSEVSELLAEQRRIAAVLQVCDQEIALLQQKRDLLQQQKQGLMQQLLTGRVRVTPPMPLDSRSDLH